MLKKRGQFWDTLIPWIIGIGVMLLGFILYFGLNGKLDEMAQLIKDFLRFGK